ncbi:hypothetical protein D3C84_1016830 [compost metagenome]
MLHTGPERQNHLQVWIAAKITQRMHPQRHIFDFRRITHIGKHAKIQIGKVLIELEAPDLGIGAGVTEQQCHESLRCLLG